MIYLDNAATTPINNDVLESFTSLAKKYFANPASSHRLGLESYKIENMARNQIAKLLSCEENEIIFTSGATESNNLAIKGIAFKYQNRGKHLITTKVEHPSVLNAFKLLEEDFNFHVTYLDVDENGVVNLEQLKKAIDDQTILVSIMAVNNEVGSINNLKEIKNILSNYPKAYFHCDATQAVGKINIDFSCVDLLSLSAHKLNGFKGSGLLLKRKNIDLMPMNSGGGQEFSYRSGTNNFPYEVSLAKTLRIALENLSSHYDYVAKLNHHLRELLKDVDGVKINSPIDGSPYILNFSIDKKASVVAEALSLKEIYVSTKSACSSKKAPTSYVLLAMGKSSFEAMNAIRVSLSYMNTLEELDIFVAELKNILLSVK